MNRTAPHSVRYGVWIAIVALATGALIWAGQRDWSSSPQTGSFSRQDAGESVAGRRGTLTDHTTEGGRVRAITESAEPLRLSSRQHARIRSIVANYDEAHVERADFTVSVGGGVPRQIMLHDTPIELADALRGYHGTKFLVVGDQLVIVDEEVRRIVVLIPNVASNDAPSNRGRR